MAPPEGGKEKTVGVSKAAIFVTAVIFATCTAAPLPLVGLAVRSYQSR